jgi:Flp pilus assembly protein TadG
LIPAKYDSGHMIRLLRLRKSKRRANTTEAGAAAVEFALVVPLLILILFSVIYFSIYFNARQGVQAAAREGARVASLRTSTAAQACSQATGALSGVPVDAVTVQIGTSASPSGGCTSTRYCSNSSGSVYVKVEGTVTFSIPGWGNPIKPVTSTAVFLCE